MKNPLIHLMVLAVLSASAAGDGAIQYSVSALPGAPGSTQNHGLAVSSAGVVGYGYVGGAFLPMAWQGGQAGVLPVPPNYQGNAMAINGSGDSVGGVLAPGEQYSEPALWHNGQLQLLSTPPGLGGMAYAINDVGTAVGSLTDSQTVTFQAVMWNGGQATVLGNFPDMQATAISINNGGQVLINADSTSWIWSNGLLTAVPSLGGSAVVGHDINNGGTVVGDLTITNGSAVTSGFIFQAGSTMLLPVLNDDLFTSARAINDSGVIVGDGYSTVDGLHAVVWQDGLIYDLNDLIPANIGWTLIDALDVANDGTIVGYGVFDGQISAFALTPSESPVGVPTPEPVTAGVLLLGGMILLRRRRSH